MEKYLLNRKEAAYRYGMSVRKFEEFYKRHPDFPIIRTGRAVMTVQKKADEWFERYIGEDTEEAAI